MVSRIIKTHFVKEKKAFEINNKLANVFMDQFNKCH